MNDLRGVPAVLAILAVLFLSGCSGLKPEPVYQDVPSVSSGETAPSSQPAAVAEPETAAAAAAASAEPTEPEPEPEPVTEPEPAPEPIVTPDDTLTGSVVSVNDAGRFVVLRFPIGHLPDLDSKLYVYRQGLKVAELKVSGPQKDDHTVADIVSGDVQKADEVRDR